MLQLIRDSKWTKAVAMLLVVVLFTELLQPQQLFAITGGPAQPEMAGFTPQNTDSMVDLFSGDFHYTIPIMTVPGPNGGFPINLNYTSGGRYGIRGLVGGPWLESQSRSHQPTGTRCS